MMLDLTNRIQGTVFGLAYGEGVALPSAVHRLGILAPKRILRMRTLGEFADDNKQTTRPFPYTHAQPGPMLNPSPADDTEWFAFVADYLLNGKKSETVWLELAHQIEGIKARTGTKLALKNLFNGQLPPETGHDNPHYFDDISMIRAVAIALLYYKDKAKLNEMVQADISITHSEDGLYCAHSIAQLFASLLRGESKSAALQDALNALPNGSWSQDEVAKALSIASKNSNTLSRTMDLEHQFIENIYAYPVSAPETLGLLLAHFINSETPEDLLFSALLHKRKLDSLPALAGAAAGVLYGTEWIPKQSKTDQISLDGVCLPTLKGMKLKDLAERISKTH